MSTHRLQFTLLVSVVLCLSGAVLPQASQQDSESSAIAGVRETLDAQVKAWNC